MSTYWITQSICTVKYNGTPTSSSNFNHKYEVGSKKLLKIGVKHIKILCQTDDFLSMLSKINRVTWFRLSFVFSHFSVKANSSRDVRAHIIDKTLTKQKCKVSQKSIYMLYSICHFCSYCFFPFFFFFDFYSWSKFSFPHILCPSFTTYHPITIIIKGFSLIWWNHCIHLKIKINK